MGQKKNSKAFCILGLYLFTYTLTLEFILVHGFGHWFTLMIPDLLKKIKNNSTYSNNASFSRESIFYICCALLRPCIINYFSDWEKKKKEGEKVKIQLPWKKNNFLEAASASELKNLLGFFL